MKRSELPEGIEIIDNREKCVVIGCNKVGQHMGQYRKDGSVIRRATCDMHHGLRYNIGGWEYKQYRKDYCENKDGRLGFECTATIIMQLMLDVDHIDGNPENNSQENLQTLCKNCHAYKTWVNQDGLTEGRKTLKEKRKLANQ